MFGWSLSVGDQYYDPYMDNVIWEITDISNNKVTIKRVGNTENSMTMLITDFKADYGRRGKKVKK